MRTRSLPLLSTLCLMGLSGPTAAAPETPTQRPSIPIEDFFETPELSAAVLSPDGQFLAAKSSDEKGKTRLVVLDLDKQKVQVAAQFPQDSIGYFQWINNERLLFDLQSSTVLAHEPLPGLFAVDRDGGKPRQLVNRYWNGLQEQPRLLPWNHFMMAQAPSMQSEYVYVLRYKVELAGAGERLYTDLWRVNTLTGDKQYVPGPPDASQWWLDTEGEPGLSMSSDNSHYRLQVRGADKTSWRELGSYPLLNSAENSMTPLALSADGKLYVRSAGGGDFDAVHTLDMRTGKVSDKPLIAVEGYDFNGDLLFRKNQLLGMHYVSDAMGTLWLDPAMKALQAEIDAQLPDTVNVLSPAASPAAANLLVQSYSDRQPTRSYVYHLPSKRLRLVGSSHSRIKPEQMAYQQVLRYPARDGMSIPALLTLPPNAAGRKLPLIVMVHAGPHQRGGEWGWSPETQFLASRGYAVLEPEFRGSSGFGQRHLRAGLKQWGLAMQDDLADGARWAIAQGYADPQRICLLGSAYGGYATLMGLIKDPALFRCGISRDGYTDFKLMYDDRQKMRSPTTASWTRYGMPQTIGELDKDAERLHATSPLAQAARLKQPLLMAYGVTNEYVGLAHGERLRDAVQAGNPHVELIIYPGDERGTQAQRIDFWRRAEQFLARQLGPAPTVSPASPQPSAAPIQKALP
ncbi:S9 family peptidase [Massilia sp. BJB1822]|uniref:alpha/beta hydrolase family protein n=1 Tax=Massilia sp. BJB1822 TaxID=2744470 RepID=UPI001593E202|nr:prolyl oligopeptidase family serine peptidase [Massilia sp. BJB1822]NVD99802.1 S9 family peptidase [Massilia sp. BJB1822]